MKTAKWMLGVLSALAILVTLTGFGLYLLDRFGYLVALAYFASIPLLLLLLLAIYVLARALGKSRARLKQIEEILKVMRYSVFYENRIYVYIEELNQRFKANMRMVYAIKGINPLHEPSEQFQFPLISDNPAKSNIEIKACDGRGNKMGIKTVKNEPRFKLYNILFEVPLKFLEECEIIITAVWPGFFSKEVEEFYYVVENPVEHLYLEIYFPEGVRPVKVRSYEFFKNMDYVAENLDGLQPSIVKVDGIYAILWHKDTPRLLRTYAIQWTYSFE